MNFLDELAGLIVSKFATIKTLLAIGKLEGRLAGLNILPLLICCMLIFVILISTWLTLNIIVGYFVWLYCGQILWTLVTILSFNIILLVFLQKYLLITLKKMSFVKTRKYFDVVLTTSENDKYAHKETDSGKNQLAGNAIANAAKQSK